jgi:excisionase family DNA binding protein
LTRYYWTGIDPVARVAERRGKAMVVIGGDEYLTVEEAAQRLGVKPATLYAYVSRGLLRSYRQGMRRRRLYRRLDVDALRRLQPSSIAPPSPEIPFAESWIRE